MWERYEDVVISVGGANSSLGVTSLAPSWPHQGLHVSALSEKWSLCLKGRMDLSDYFLFCFVLFFRSWDIWALKEFLQRFGAFSFVPRGSSASPPSAMLWLAVWIQTWPVCFLLPLCHPPSLYPLFPPPLFLCICAYILFYFFCMCTYSWDTWLVGVVQRNQPVYICSCGVFCISFFNYIFKALFFCLSRSQSV